MRFLSLPSLPAFGMASLVEHVPAWCDGSQRGSGGDLVNSIETQSVYEHHSGVMRTLAAVTV